MKKIFKILAYIIVFIAISGISILMYIDYEDNKHSEERLLFGEMGGEKWKWQNEYKNIQMRDSENGLQLRQIAASREWYSVISISKEHDLDVMSAFKADCKPGTKIKTGKVSDLYCTSNGRWLAAFVKYGFPEVDWDRSYEDTSFLLDLGVFNSKLTIPNSSLKLLEMEYILNKAAPLDSQVEE